jgi:hypothetical protein
VSCTRAGDRKGFVAGMYLIAPSDLYLSRRTIRGVYGVFKGKDGKGEGGRRVRIL